MSAKTASTIRLPATVAAWGRADFSETAVREIEGLDAAQLPLQQALTASSHVAGQGFTVTMLNVAETDRLLVIRVGVFYAGVVAGCSCAGDPTPVGENPEYCEIDIAVDKASAEARISLCGDESSMP